MKTKLILSTMFFTVFIFMIHSCSDNVVEDLSNDSNSGTKLDKSIISDELAELIDIREEITQMVIDKKVDLDKLHKAYQIEDKDKIMELMQMSEQEYNAYDKRLMELREEILKKYPKIKSKVEEMNIKGYETCNSDKFFTNFENYTFASKRQGNGLSKVIVYQTSEEVDCDWIPFTAGLILCSQAGPIFYWPCAYVVICDYCSGGWVDDVCI